MSFLYNLKCFWKKAVAVCRRPGKEKSAFSVSGCTNPGKVRNNNEDCYFICPEKNIYLIADGMGGHLGGEVASRLAVEVVAKFLSENINSKLFQDRSYLFKLIVKAFQKANVAVVNKGRSAPSLAGMGCTLICAVVLEHEAFIGHVGDVRCYYLSNGQLSQLTSDHALSKESNQNNVVTRCIGAPASAGPDCTTVTLGLGDRLLFCSDGLWSMLNDADIHEILIRHLTCAETCEGLITQANAAGGHDNLTAIVVERNS